MAVSRRHEIRRRAEPMVALINVVFLLLIFLLIAGTVARPVPGELALVEAEGLEATSPPDAAVVMADGTLRYRGETISPEAYATAQMEAGERSLRLVPDRDLPARRLVELVIAMRSVGAEEVWIVTERGLP